MGPGPPGEASIATSQQLIAETSSPGLSPGWAERSSSASMAFRTLGESFRRSPLAHQIRAWALNWDLVTRRGEEGPGSAREEAFSRITRRGRPRHSQAGPVVRRDPLQGPDRADRGQAAAGTAGSAGVCGESALFVGEDTAFGLLRGPAHPDPPAEARAGEPTRGSGQAAHRQQLSARACLLSQGLRLIQGAWAVP